MLTRDVDYVGDVIAITIYGMATLHYRADLGRKRVLLVGLLKTGFI